MKIQLIMKMRKKSAVFTITKFDTGNKWKKFEIWRKRLSNLKMHATWLNVHTIKSASDIFCVCVFKLSRKIFKHLIQNFFLGGSQVVRWGRIHRKNIFEDAKENHLLRYEHDTKSWFFWLQWNGFKWRISPTTQQRLKVFLTGAIEEASLIFSTGKLSQEQKFFFYLNSV